MQCLGREWVIICGFPPVVCLCSNWGVYFHRSRGWCSSEWCSQLL